MQLSEQQQQAVDLGVEALKSGTDMFRIGGAAGTGKSTILAKILERTHGVGVAAYAGKAAHVLRQKGITNATTIHKKIYSWDGQRFQRNKGVPFMGFAIDEASMVGSQILGDLQRYMLPILAIGDNHQLKPIGDDTISLMENLDFELTEVFRHQNAVLDRATDIRELNKWSRDYPARQLKDDIHDYDVIICPFNKQRIVINQKFRGTTDPMPRVGDRIISLRNNYDIRTFNGQMYEIVALGTQICSDSYNMRLRDIEGIERWYPVGIRSFYTERPEKFNYQEYMVADYGYGITCHKAQGSEWDKVGVLYTECKRWDMRRWLYTAVTRAAESVRIYS